MEPQQFMKALVRTDSGLQLTADCPVPQPGVGEVLIKVTAFSISSRDFTGLPGQIVGSGVAGRVVALGEDVPAWRLGDVVIVDPGLGSGDGAGGLLGIDRDGGAAEFLVATAIDACASSPSLGSDTLPLLAYYYSQAERVLTWSRLYSGETIIILGAEQGSGPAAVELAALRGARVYATAEEWAHPALEELGARQVEKSADRLTVKQAHVVADFRIGCTSRDCLSNLVPDGVYVSFSGEIARTSGNPMSAIAEPDIFTMETLEHLARMAEHGAIVPKPASIVDFSSLNDSLMELFNTRQIGPTVFRID
ncbi:alcohol dehydrogenase catalytic domain-containing protein [Mesorhizobium sp.]|uniref:alcohol dehydrogenase catalytic domain-containing protein n=1 Tax=Mesorhizobium sp. TaxID=1871066 RepID=UPI0025E916F7|nr:alcohol dehydrogenase catalytic domain-containing protein [Mesorhizobium sp.]